MTQASDGIGIRRKRQGAIKELCKVTESRGMVEENTW
jgi:hypothetical protein